MLAHITGQLPHLLKVVSFGFGSVRMPNMTSCLLNIAQSKLLQRNKQNSVGFFKRKKRKPSQPKACATPDCASSRVGDDGGQLQESEPRQLPRGK